MLSKNNLGEITFPIETLDNNGHSTETSERMIAVRVVGVRSDNSAIRRKRAKNQNNMKSYKKTPLTNTGKRNGKT